MSSSKIPWTVEFTEKAAAERDDLDSERSAALKGLIERLTDDPMPDDAHRLHLGDELWQLLEVEHGVCLTYIIVHSVVVVMVIQVWTSQPPTETE